jgi:hypothetical protein
MTLQISDPLALLPYQTGLIAPPLEEGAAEGQSTLDTIQRAIVLGEPVPIVFGRRVNGIGGVFVSPGATEGRFQNNSTTNELTVRYQLVLSEGELPPLQLRDVFQRACRVGTWAQAYDARAGNWTPGNFIVTVAGKVAWNAPFYCGTGGTYANMTTLSYLNTHADGDQTWDKQVHTFVRQGIQVTRILDNTYGSSNNLIDLSLYLIRQSSRFPELMIDLDGMEAAAKFTNANGLFYNGIFNESTNLENWLQEIARSFLLRISDNGGKKSFRPRLPVNTNGTIFTGAVPWVFTFTEEHVLPDGFDIQYIPLTARKPICAQMLWRQQPDDDIGIIRSTEVRFTGEAINGPFEQYDLSNFCTSENHAVKIGAYEVARRKFIEHTLRLQVRPSSFNSTIRLGDIVRVELRRESTEGQVTLHNYLYEVERINRNISGSIELDLTHFPVNKNGQSLLAMYVLDAEGAGFQLPTGRDNFQCDTPGRDEDEDPIPLDPYTDPGLPPSDDFDYDLPVSPDFDPEPAPPGGGFDDGGGPANPPDPLEEDLPLPIEGATGDGGTPVVGDILTIPEICPGMKTNWYLCDPNGGCTLVASGLELVELIVLPEYIDFTIYGEGCCPDPGSPSGFAQCVETADTPPVRPDTTEYEYARWTGTIFEGLTGTTTAFTSPWTSYSSFLTIGGAFQTTSGPSFAIEGKYEEGIDQFWFLPPTGPIPWRASVEAFDDSGNFGGFPKGLGFLGIEANPAMSLTSPQPGVGMPNTTDVGVTYAITGKWQFSNDQSTVLVEWDGDTSAIRYEEPEL